MRGTLQPVLKKFGVTFRVMHGFASATAINDIAEVSLQSDKPLRALYVGDFDPSGMFMSEVDLPERLGRYGADVDLERVALLQYHLSDLPSFDAADKTLDGRYQWFVENYGTRCWELDALSPVDLRAEVECAIRALIDMPAWEHAIIVEQAQVESMQAFHDQWTRRIGARA